VEGYDLRYLAYNDYMGNYPGVPDIVLVRKAKDTEKKKNKSLKPKKLEDFGIAVEGDDKKKKKNVKDEESDYEEFLDELE